MLMLLAQRPHFKNYCPPSAWHSYFQISSWFPITSTWDRLPWGFPWSQKHAWCPVCGGSAVPWRVTAPEYSQPNRNESWRIDAPAPLPLGGTDLKGGVGFPRFLSGIEPQVPCCHWLPSLPSLPHPLFPHWCFSSSIPPPINLPASFPYHRVSFWEGLPPESVELMHEKVQVYLSQRP